MIKKGILNRVRKFMYFSIREIKDATKDIIKCIQSYIDYKKFGDKYGMAEVEVAKFMETLDRMIRTIIAYFAIVVLRCDKYSSFLILPKLNHTWTDMSIGTYKDLDDVMPNIIFSLFCTYVEVEMNTINWEHNEIVRAYKKEIMHIYDWIYNKYPILRKEWDSKCYDKEFEKKVIKYEDEYVFRIFKIRDVLWS